MAYVKANKRRQEKKLQQSSNSAEQNFSHFKVIKQITDPEADLLKYELRSIASVDAETGSRSTDKSELKSRHQVNRKTMNIDFMNRFNNDDCDKTNDVISPPVKMESQLPQNTRMLYRDEKDLLEREGFSIGMSTPTSLDTTAAAKARQGLSGCSTNLRVYGNLAVFCSSCKRSLREPEFQHAHNMPDVKQINEKDQSEKGDPSTTGWKLHDADTDEDSDSDNLVLKRSSKQWKIPEILSSDED